MNLTPTDRVFLRDALVSRFSDPELQALCFELGIDYENIPGSTKMEKAQNIVAFCERTDIVPELRSAIKRARPNITFPKTRKNSALLEKSSYKVYIASALAVAVIIAVMIVSFNWGRNSNSTNASIASTSTAITILNTPERQVEIATAESYHTDSAEQTVISYFRAIDEGRHEFAWDKLTQSYKNKHNSSGFGEYATWWTNEGDIEISVTRVVEQSDYAVYDVYLTHPSNSVPSRNWRLTLLYVTSDQAWKVDDYCNIDVDCP